MKDRVIYITFFENLMTVAYQVAILFILISIGYICNKTKLLNGEAAKKLSNLALVIVTPAVIIKSFIREFDSSMLKDLGIVCLITMLFTAITIVLVQFMLKDNDEKRARVFKFAAVLGNTGFIGLPLQKAILGDTGVFFGSAIVSAFNVMLWSYGVVQMSGDKKLIMPKKLITSPGITAVVIGLILFLTSLSIPPVIVDSIGYVAALNTPLPMIIIGYYLADAGIVHAFTDIKCYLCCFYRLILFPLISIIGIYLCGLHGELYISYAIAACTPVCTATTMFSERYQTDTILSVRLVSMSTVLSLLTMPAMIALAQMLIS